MAPSLLLQTVTCLAVLSLAFAAFTPPGALSFLGRRFVVPKGSLIECTPSPDGSPLPDGCNESGHQQTSSSYGNPEETETVKVVEQGPDFRIVEDENAGNFIITIPDQQLQRDQQEYNRKRCFFRHIYIPELDLCVLPRYRYQPGSHKYPGLTAYFRR